MHVDIDDDGNLRHHHRDGGHHHEGGHDLGVHAEDFARGIDNIELTTVGIDIGSATSHVMFARVLLKRASDSLSSRFVVAAREVVYRAPALLTPYVSGELIDAAALQRHIADAYEAAGQTRDSVDTGVVILTGVALERRNARAIADVFADQGGKFVCATAGHRLEALLAAHGSGSVAQSRHANIDVLNIDIGGGTTKFAAISGGKVIATCAVAVGGRLVAWDDDGLVQRIEPAARDLARELGLFLELNQPFAVESRERIAQQLVERIFAVLEHTVDGSDVLAGDIPPSFRPAAIVLSGGVAQIISAEAGSSISYNDLGNAVATELSRRLDQSGLSVSVASEALHATVVGAAQFTVQVSGNTLHIADPTLLPMRDVPVAVVNLHDLAEPTIEEVRSAADEAVDRLDLGGRREAVVLVLDWDGIPRHRVLSALAHGLHGAHLASSRADTPLVIAVTADIAANLGNVLAREVGMEDAFAVIDGVELSDLDFLDIGEVISPANVVPLMIKSLFFAPREDRTDSQSIASKEM